MGNTASQMDELRQRNAQLEQRNAQLEQRNAQLEAQVAQLQADLAEEKAERVSEVAQLRAQLAQLAEQVRKCQRERLPAALPGAPEAALGEARAYHAACSPGGAPLDLPQLKLLPMPMPMPMAHKRGLRAQPGQPSRLSGS